MSNRRNPTSPQEMQRARANNMHGARRTFIQRAREAARHHHLPQEERDKLEQMDEENPEFVDISYSRKTLLLLCGYPLLFFAWVVDTIMLSAAVEFLVGLATASAGIVSWACFIVPIPIIGLEAYAATQKYAAGQQPRLLGDLAQSDNWAEYRKWQRISLMMAIIIPALFLGTYMQRLAVQGAGMLLEGTITMWGLTMPSWLLMIGGTALAFVAHGLVIFGGATAHMGRAYTHYRLRRWRQQRQFRQEEDADEERCTAAAEGFETWWMIRQDHNQNHPDSVVAPPPFDTRVRSIINEIYGQEVIPEPAEGNQGIDPGPPMDAPSPSGDGAPSGSSGPGGADRMPEPPPVDDGGDAEDAEESYLERVLRRRRADADGELRP